MLKKEKRLITSGLLLAAMLPASVQAGHMFTQASSNTPTWIQQGQGIAIQQYGTEGSSGYGNISINFQAPTTGTPAGITQTVGPNDWWDWSAGDVMRINLPLSDATYTYTIAYDAASGGTCAYDYCGVSTAGYLDVATSGTPQDLSTANTALTLPAHSGERYGGGYTTSDVYFGWSITAVAGEFSLGGYRLYTSNGTIDGTGAGPLDQSSVVTAEEADNTATGGTTTPTNRPINGAGDLIGGLGSTTTYQFDGGTLVTDADVASNFTITDNGGSMDVADGASQTFSGTLSDETGACGEFIKSGGGRLVVTGTNTQSCGTTVEGGVLEVSSDGNLGAASGGLTLDGGALATSGDLSTGRSVTVGAGNGEVQAAAGTTLALTGSVSGAGNLTSSGSGVLDMSGSTVLAGNFNVTGGRVNLGGTVQAAGMNVGAGATLSGSGTLTGDLVNDGTIQAGNSPGTLTVAGDVTLNSGSTVDIDVDGLTYSAAGGAGSYDRIAVTGAASVFTAGGEVAPILRGITGDATNTFDPSIGDAFRIVTTENATGVTGTFATVTNPTLGMPANTRFDVLYGANYIDLVLTPESFGTLVTGFGIRNLDNFATALDDARPDAGTNAADDMTALMQEFYGLNSTQLSTVMLQLSGQIHAFALADVRDTSRGSAETVLHQMDSNVKDGDNMWFDISGFTSANDADSVASASDTQHRSFWLGSDLSSTDTATFGLGFGYTNGTVDAGVYGTSDQVSKNIALYGFGERGALRYEGVFVTGRGTLEGERTTSLASGDVTNTFATTTTSTTVKGRVGYSSDMGHNVNAVTWFGGEVNVTETGAYTEQGNALTALSVGEASVRTTRLNLGVELNGKITEASHWNVAFGATRALDNNGSPYLSRDLSLHGAEWTASEAESGLTTKYLNIGFSGAISDNANFWAQAGLSRSGTGGSIGRQVGFGIDVRF